MQTVHLRLDKSADRGQEFKTSAGPLLQTYNTIKYEKMPTSVGSNSS